ncbi:hypothetical protein Tco_0775438 [Tanacetum coccineum]
MDSIIILGQKNTLAEYMILSGVDNRPSMLDKDLYDSWKSRMELYMQNRENGRMILESVENCPLIWPTVEENGVTRTKKYSCQGFLEESSITDASLPPEWSKFVTDVKLVKDLHTTNFDQLHAYLKQHELHANEVRFMRECFAIPVFSPGDDPIACLNKAMAFLTAVASSRMAGHSATSSGETRQSYSGTGYKSNATSSVGNNTSRQASTGTKTAFLAILSLLIVSSCSIVAHFLFILLNSPWAFPLAESSDTWQVD